MKTCLFLKFGSWATFLVLLVLMILRFSYRENLLSLLLLLAFIFSTISVSFFIVIDSVSKKSDRDLIEQLIERAITKAQNARFEHLFRNHFTSSKRFPVQVDLSRVCSRDYLIIFVLEDLMGDWWEEDFFINIIICEPEMDTEFIEYLLPIVKNTVCQRLKLKDVHVCVLLSKDFGRCDVYIAD